MSAPHNWVKRVWDDLAKNDTPLSVVNGKVMTVADAVKIYRASMYQHHAKAYADALSGSRPMLAQRTDDQTALFARHLAIQTLAGIEMHEYAPAKFANGGLISITSEVDEGTDVYAWLEQRINTDGAKLLANDADDIPLVEVDGDLNIGNVATWGVGYYYTRQDTRKSAQQRRQLIQDKAVATRETMDRKLNSLLIDGEAGTKFVGMRDVGIDLEATNGDWASTTETGANIATELRTAMNAINVESSGVETPDTVVMPQDTFRYLSTTAFDSANSNDSILMVLKGYFPEIKRWDWAPEMRTAGSDSGGALFMYHNDPSRIRAEVPMPPTPMELERRGRRFVTEMEGRYGGIILKRPNSFLKLSNVEPVPT